MSRVYTCIKCHTAMGTEVSLNPYCSTCRMEQAIVSQSSRRSYRPSYEDQILDSLNDIFRELTSRGLR